VDTDVVLGEGCERDAFTDDRLAAALDHIHAYGTDDLLAAVVRGYFARRPGPGELLARTPDAVAAVTSAEAWERPSAGYW
jgi:hypothetical protein